MKMKPLEAPETTARRMRIRGVGFHPKLDQAVSDRAWRQRKTISAYIRELVLNDLGKDEADFA